MPSGLLIPNQVILNVQENFEIGSGGSGGFTRSGGGMMRKEEKARVVEIEQNNKSSTDAAPHVLTAVE
jgi:hypothetical protein